MTLTPATHLGPYEIVELIGVGEVYRARDVKLKTRRGAEGVARGFRGARR